MNNINFKISDPAKTHLAEAIKKRGSGVGIKVGLKTTGCSGLSYTLEYVDDPLADCPTVAAGDYFVYIDPAAAKFLEGTELDYESGLMRRGFKFKNPNEKSRCGCGESFKVKEDAGA